METSEPLCACQNFVFAAKFCSLISPLRSLPPPRPQFFFFTFMFLRQFSPLTCSRFPLARSLVRSSARSLVLTTTARLFKAHDYISGHTRAGARVHEAERAKLAAARWRRRRRRQQTAEALRGQRRARVGACERRALPRLRGLGRCNFCGLVYKAASSRARARATQTNVENCANNRARVN